MHTFDGERATFNYNSDLSGDVEITLRLPDGTVTMPVPATDILKFVAEYLRSQRISQLEDAEWHTFFPDLKLKDATEYGAWKP